MHLKDTSLIFNASTSPFEKLLFIYFEKGGQGGFEWKKMEYTGDLNI